VNADRRRILGYDVFAHASERCVAEMAAAIARGGRPRWLACLNPHSYVVALDRPDFAAALAAADWLVADGAGVVLASRVLGAAVSGRVTGSDVFEGLSRRLDADGARVFFLGADEGTLGLVRGRYEREHPRLTVAGTLAPPFRPDFSPADDDAMVAAVNAARADVLWVGLGAPKQEVWIHRVIGRLDVRVVAAVGGVFDFYAGRVRRAGPALQRVGLEWLPRLVQQPRRLWRRTFVSAPVFLWHVGREWVARALPGARPGGE
jgi:N-acetylglucosaminyldiphosphoundecaprenol N-acetyl-beta-D-mannosaminyltransferase